MTSKHGILLAMALMGATAAQAACPSVSTATRYSFNVAGDEVTDNRTGLVWARCSAGQSWNGSTCNGTASSHSHEQALQLVLTARGWRLPNVKELSSIADKGCQSPAIDSAAFPNTPNAFYWSSSPYVGHADLAWGAGFDVGSTGYLNRFLPFEVRLVRASQ